MTVNNVNALLAYAGRADAAGSVADESADGSFEQIMSKVNGKTDVPQTGISNGNSTANQTVVPAVDTVKKDLAVEQKPAQNADKTDQKSDTVHRDQDGNIAQDTRTDGRTDNDTAAAEEVEKSAKDLVEDIAEKMDMTPEEVEKAMEILGLTAVELFDTDNLKQLLLSLSGNTDEMALLTDETLYGNLQDLLGTVEESLTTLQEELGLSDEEMEALMKQMLAGQDGTGVVEEPEVNLEGMKDYTVSVQKDGETVQVKVTVDDESGNRWMVKYFNSPKNLHSIWDSSLPESAHKWSYTEWQQQIDRATPEEEAEIIADGSPEKWGKECYQIAAEVYNTTPEDSKLSYDYIAKWTPVIEEQFLRGGLRLADLLNSIFDPHYAGANNIIKKN